MAVLGCNAFWHFFWGSSLYAMFTSTWTRQTKWCHVYIFFMCNAIKTHHRINRVHYHTHTHTTRGYKTKLTATRTKRNKQQQQRNFNGTTMTTQITYERQPKKKSVIGQVNIGRESGKKLQLHKSAVHENGEPWMQKCILNGSKKCCLAVKYHMHF